jgi:hypothetical protein
MNVGVGAFTKEKKNNGFFYVKKQMAYNWS